MEEKRDSFLYKKLDLAFVYIFIFVFGLILVFAMTSYLRNKVNEFSYDTQTASK